jgi:DNA-binding response OmpR family regulator
VTSPGRERRVLVVDDDASIRAVVRAVLEADGVVVDEALDGLVALERVAASPPSLVILDIMMPGMDGIEVCRRIDTEQVLVLMLTARDDPASERECLAAGARQVLGKPFSAIELLDLVETLFRVEAS